MAYFLLGRPLDDVISRWVRNFSGINRRCSNWNLFTPASCLVVYGWRLSRVRI